MSENVATKITEKYILSESGEMMFGLNSRWRKRIAHAFPVFESRNYSLYFCGQFVSLIGTWLQSVALGWMVLELTNSAFLLSIVAAVGSTPYLFLSLFGGVIVDHFPKKYVLMTTQIASMILALLLGLLTVSNLLTIYHVVVIALLFGIVNAIDSPARQAYIVELVGKEYLHSAIALNSGMFNAARVVGPSIAGFLIAVVGSGGAFLLNGISYGAAIISLYLITTPTTATEKRIHPLSSIKDGLSYASRHPIIKHALLYIGASSIFAWSYGTILPIIARDSLNLDASGLGFLYAATGLGALVAAFGISAYGNKINRPAYIFGGTVLFSVAIILFTITTNVTLAMVLLFFVGIGLLSMAATVNTVVQSYVEDRYRGRVMSIYTLMFIGLTPLGNLEIGFIAERLGTAHAIQVNAFIVLLLGFGMMTLINSVRKKHRIYSLSKIASSVV